MAFPLLTKTENKICFNDHDRLILNIIKAEPQPIEIHELKQKIEIQDPVGSAGFKYTIALLLKNDLVNYDRQNCLSAA